MTALRFLIAGFIADDEYGSRGETLRRGMACLYSGTYDSFVDYCKEHGIGKREIPDISAFLSEMDSLGYPLWIFAPRPRDTLEDGTCMLCPQWAISRWYRHCDPVRCTYETAPAVLEVQREKHRGYWEDPWCWYYDPTDGKIQGVYQRRADWDAERVYLGRMRRGPSEQDALDLIAARKETGLALTLDCIDKILTLTNKK